MPNSAVANVLGSIKIDLPPSRPGSRWRVLWREFGELLPHLIRLKETTFYFRHRGQPMDSIIPLVPSFGPLMIDLRLSPVHEERYDEHAGLSNQQLYPLVDSNDSSLPWASDMWPTQLASLGPVQNIALVTNMLIVWPPVPDQEEKIMQQWTSELERGNSKLRSIQISYLDDRDFHTRPRWDIARDRYINLLRREPVAIFAGEDIVAKRQRGEIISEEFLRWEKWDQGWFVQ
ncbi:hypothetical protein HWV62_29360 [Athelia sp. TMB]|nr:hypothetical protein HWV62_29360 [Athelia sp. TMB]